MDGGHPEKALAASELEIEHLEDVGDDIGYEDYADEGQEEPLVGHEGAHGEEGPEGESARVAHEDHGGVGVPPEEGQEGSGYGEAEGDHGLRPLEESDHTVGGEGDGGSAAGQGVQAVG